MKIVKKYEECLEDMRKVVLSMQNNALGIEIEKIVRSKRKTISLHITDNASLVVRAPFGVSKQIIEDIIKKHAKWIRKKQQEILSRNLKVVKKEFVNGENFLYLGEYYKLTITNNQKEALIFNNGFFLSKTYLPLAKNVFINWYKQKAYEKVIERVKWYSKNIGLKYNKINITNAQKQLGSCSTKGNLNFSWRLIMAPLHVIDYVVVHELVHLIEMNHSKSFWNKLSLFLPDYHLAKDWIKTYEYLLRL